MASWPASATPPAPQSSLSSPSLVPSSHSSDSYHYQSDSYTYYFAEYYHNPVTYSKAESSYSVKMISCIVIWLVLKMGRVVAVVRGIIEGWKRNVMEGGVRKRAFVGMGWLSTCGWGGGFIGGAFRDEGFEGVIGIAIAKGSFFEKSYSLTLIIIED